jgi:hypothetical protein
MPTPKLPWDGPRNARGHRPKHCRACGEVGHDARTCKTDKRCALCRQMLPLLPPEPHCCTTCGKSGHNSKTCPDRE